MQTVLTSIRLPQELYEWLKNKAEKEHRTLSNTIVSLLLDLKESERKNDKGKVDAEKIKKGLEMCFIRYCDKCPYDDEKSCSDCLMHDALTLIEELETKLNERMI